MRDVHVKENFKKRKRICSVTFPPEKKVFTLKMNRVWSFQWWRFCSTQTITGTRLKHIIDPLTKNKTTHKKPIKKSLNHVPSKEGVLLTGESLSLLLP